MKKIILGIVLCFLLTVAPMYGQAQKDTLSTTETIELIENTTPVQEEPKQKEVKKDVVTNYELQKELERERELRRGYQVSTVVLFLFAFVLALVL